MIKHVFIELENKDVQRGGAFKGQIQTQKAPQTSGAFCVFNVIKAIALPQ